MMKFIIIMIYGKSCFKNPEFSRSHRIEKKRGDVNRKKIPDILSNNNRGKKFIFIRLFKRCFKISDRWKQNRY